MAEVVLRVYVSGIQMNHFRVDFFVIITDECVLLVAFVQRHVLLE
jgi:hypothetical protein